MDLTLKTLLFPSRKKRGEQCSLKAEIMDLLRKVDMIKWKCEVSSAFPSELYKTACQLT